MEDSNRLLQLESVVGKASMGGGVHMACHGGSGGMGGENTMVTLLVAWINPEGT